MYAAALGTRLRNAVCEAAIMAGKLVELLVIGECDVAVRASRHPTAVFTFYSWRETAAILKQNDLLFFGHRFAYGL